MRPFLPRPSSININRILHFWFNELATPVDWFRRNPDVDAAVSQRFGVLHARAAAGALGAWAARADGALARILLLDQFSRNIYRDDPRAFAADSLARAAARNAVARRFDMIAGPDARAFFYMPFMHSEALADQDLCVALFKARLPGGFSLPYAIEHRDIVRRFGRFPHRNAVLGRASTPMETQYLAHGGFSA